MKGDFTRFTFDPHKHYSRVLMQQGRVQLDADWNEMVETQLHFLRALAADLIGPHGTPSGPDGEPGKGFQISLIAPNGMLEDLNVDFGHYYVKGILCENEKRVDADGAPLAVRYYSQPHLRLDPAKDELPDLPFLVYLDVWERHVTYIEDTDQSERTLGIREVALRGPDTTTRTQIVWQVKCQELTVSPAPVEGDNVFKTNYAEFLNTLPTLDIRSLSSGRLSARARKPFSGDTDPCLTSPEARYHGAENQLYRVEIHQGGGPGTATLKFSCENGAVVFSIEKLEGNIVTLTHLGHDPRFGLRPDDWVEIVDDDYVLQSRAEPLRQIEKIDPDTLRVTLKPLKTSLVSTVGQLAAKHPLLRRWDQRTNVSLDGDIPIVEKSGDEDSAWIQLEDGIQIQFPPAPEGEPHVYRTGDYWLIPARFATGDVEWPGTRSDPLPQPPHGVVHHYAPLAVVSDEGGNITVEDCRRTINPLWKEKEEL